MLSLQQLLVGTETNERIVAIHKGKAVDFAQLRTDVATLSATLSQRNEKCFALYEESSYAFAVGLFALLHTGKAVVIPGNNTEQTLLALKQQTDGLLGCMPGATLSITTLNTKTPTVTLKNIDNISNQITIFTSGSTGQPKAIPKSLAQLDAEIKSLESCFGEKIGHSDIIATVSHQHIYGLLFRILWPLATGRVFHDDRALDSALVLKHIIDNKQPAIWIASPAHLKRLHNLLPWQSAKSQLKAIFSSGGPLPSDAALNLHEWFGESAIEVFGSSETGGIAWRQQCSPTPQWQPLPDVKIKTDNDQRLWVLSPHINADQWYATDDSACTSNDTFMLLGRLDRIVKLEEKRLSLVEMEQQLQAHECVKEAYCLLLAPENSHRESLAAAIVLDRAGQLVLQIQGKLALTQQLKHHLATTFELSLLPRKWRFIEHLPTNAQSKIDLAAVKGLFSHHE